MESWSDKEVAMLQALGAGHLLERFTEDPLLVYRFAMEKAFIEDTRGPAADSLRRCMRALSRCTAYRLTPEWDALIHLEEDTNA